MIRTVFIFFLFLLTFFHLSYAEIPEPWNADNYAKNALLQQNWAEKFFFQNYDFQGNETILDIGSGRGNITAMLANYTPKGKVIGIDNSKSMIDRSQRDYKHINNLQFLFKDAQDLTFYSKYKNRFDIITSFSTLHWIQDQNKVLNGIYISLKPGGTCFLRLTSKGGDPIQDIADKLIIKPAWKTYFKEFKDPVQRFSIGEYALLIEQHKFKIISIKDAEDRDLLINIDKFHKQIKSWLPHYFHLEAMDKEKSEKFVEEIASNYLQKYPRNKDGSLILYDHYLEVIATKELR